MGTSPTSSSAGSATTDNSTMPVYVDMDGTLVNTDIAQELILQCFKKLSLFSELIQLAFSGRSKIKRFLALNTEFSEERLPYNQKVIDYLKAQKEAGRSIVLATASDALIAEKVANYLGFFDDVLASEPGNNLKGANKLKAIQAHSGDNGFEYIGDSKADYPIWKAADLSGFVNVTSDPASIVADKKRHSLKVNDRNDSFAAFIKAIRPHQWAKNLLVFLPLFFSHLYLNVDALFSAALTFIVFSLCASGIYLVNDLLDIEADREHVTKRKRPFAAAKLRPVTGVLASLLLVFVALVACFFLLNVKTFLVLVIYMIITNLYSFYLKDYSTIDVITLTSLYTIRIVAGAVAVGVVLSPWLFNFSLFFFLSLAYMKRYIEVARYAKEGKLSGRNYSADETNIIMMMGIVNGGIAIFTLTMYLNGEYVLSTYLSPHLLWLICPLLLFWIYRAWMWAKRDKIDDDPVVFAIKDKVSIVTAILVALLFIFSKYFDLNSVLL